MHFLLERPQQPPILHGRSYSPPLSDFVYLINNVIYPERFEDPEVRKSVKVDLAIIDSFNEILKKLGISNRISERLPLACQEVSERFLK